MSGLAADLLVLWVAATAACAALLGVVVLVQSALARARHHRAVRRRTTGDRRAVRFGSGMSPGGPPPAPR